MKVKLSHHDRCAWHRYFVWFPATTEDGYFVWLEFVFRKWDNEVWWKIIDIYDPGEWEGGWIYSITAAPRGG